MNTNILKYDNVHNASAVRAQFTDGHFARLAELHEKAWSFVGREDVTLTQLQRALAIELRMEKYMHELTQREERAKKAAQPRPAKAKPQEKADSTPAGPVPPTPESATPPPPTQTKPSPLATPHSSPAPAPEEVLCFAKQKGYACHDCPSGRGGICPMQFK